MRWDHNVKDGAGFVSEDPAVPALVVPDGGTPERLHITTNQPTGQGGHGNVTARKRGLQVYSKDGGLAITNVMSNDRVASGDTLAATSLFYQSADTGLHGEDPRGADRTVGLGYGSQSTAADAVAIGGGAQRAQQPHNVILGHWSPPDGEIMGDEQRQARQNGQGPLFIVSPAQVTPGFGSATPIPAEDVDGHTQYPFLTRGPGGVLWKKFAMAAGPAGPAGPQGEPGPQGPKGPTGPAGPAATTPTLYAATVSARIRVTKGQMAMVLDWTALPYGWQWASVVVSAVGGASHGITISPMFRQGAYCLRAQTTRSDWMDGYSLIIIPWR